MPKRKSSIKWLLILLIALTLISIFLNIINPSKNAFRSELNGTVREYIASIALPKDGKDATPEQIAEAVSQYLAKNPPQKGTDAPPITKEQIALAVREYLQANPPANGLDGENGRDGVDGTSCSTQNVEGGAIIICEDGTSSFIANGQNGADGRTPMLRCNTSKNRWEIRYDETENWSNVKDQNGNNVKCTTAGL